MIANKEQFDRFIDILPDLEKDEVYFVSLSARNKYLTEEERKEFSLGRTEMFSREVARDKLGLYYAMDKLKASLEYRKTANSKEIPSKCLVVYANINPSSTIKAYQLFKQAIDKEVNDVMQALLNSREPNYEGLKKINRELMNSIQKSRSRKCFIDIDVDLFDKNIDPMGDIDSIDNFLKETNTQYHKIKTFSGYHFLIRKDTVPDTLYRFIDSKRYSVYIKDINFNKNEMIPIPGTLQANKLVRFI
jgi:hypothetical protein